MIDNDNFSYLPALIVHQDRPGWMIYAHPKLSKARNPYWAKNYLHIILGHQASASSALLIPTEVSQHLFGYCQTTNAQVSIIEAILVFWSLLLDNDSILLARGEKHNSTSVQPRKDNLEGTNNSAMGNGQEYQTPPDSTFMWLLAPVCSPQRSAVKPIGLYIW